MTGPDTDPPADRTVAQVFLADAAVLDPSGKVHCLGAGWTVTSSPTGPHAVVVLLRVAWEAAGVPQRLVVALIDADGRAVPLPTVHGPEQLRVQAEVAIGRPEGLPAGSSLDAPFVLPVAPLPLPPGRYEYRVSIGDEVFHAPFDVRG